MKQSILLATIAILIISSCTSVEDGNECNELFSTSFEESSDYEMFEGYAYASSDDVTTNAGDSSLYVCGGCIAPHLYFDIGPFDQDYDLSVSFIAKTDLQASVSVYPVNGINDKLAFTIEDSIWTLYEHEQTLFLAKGELLRMEFLSGGIAAVNSYFDLLQVCAE